MTGNDSRKVSAAIATAACTLLGGAAPSPVQADEDRSWDFNTALLYYGENDGRVEDASLSVQAIRNFLDDRSLTLGLSVDTLTGATPSGAIRLGMPQTLTSPSGNAVYSVAPGTLPLDDTFLDTRVALTANWEQPFATNYRFNLGFSASDEYDYTHVGVNGRLSRDFNQRNTTVSAGISIASDSIEPVGGAPQPLSAMLDVGDVSNRTGDKDKDIVDLVLGVTQVVSRNLLVQANYSYSDSSGYLNDPYKILSIVDPVTGDTVMRSPPPGTSGPSHEFVFESRPDSRTKHSLFSQAKYFWNDKVLDASYRYMTDDWDIDSHTLDLRLRWPVGADRFLEPHLRFYTQSAADFYRVSLADGASLPAFASSDYRLGDFDAITAGLKYGWQTAGGNDMSVRLELYRQRGDIPGALLFGNQPATVEYPDLDAIIAQFSYRFGKRR